MKAVLFDLDGVIYEGNRAISGAAEAIDWFRSQGIPHLFVTNTSSRPRSALAEKLARFGLQIPPQSILAPPVVAARWLKKNIKGQVALFVPETTRQEFTGLPLLPGNAESGAAAVVIGYLGKGWDFATLNRAFRLLMAEPRPQLIALGMSRYWQTAEGLTLDVAPFVVALENASGLQALVLGKPAAPFFEAALEQLGAKPSAACMVGDDIQVDIGAAQTLGLRGILVRTGKYRPTDLEQGIEPAAVLDSVADLPAWWQKQQAAGEWSD